MQFIFAIRRSEYDTLGTSIKAALVYLGTALVKVSNAGSRILRKFILFSFFFSGIFYCVMLCLSLLMADGFSNVLTASLLGHFS